MKQFTFILILALLSPALAYSQTNGGLHVNGSHNFMVPVDSLDIRPWAADFTVSFTIDFDSIKDNATTSLLGLRSREWDGTDKADRGTMWVDCINENDTMYLSYGVRYFNGIVSDTVKLPAGFSGAHTVSLYQSVGHITDSDLNHLITYGYWFTVTMDGEIISEKIKDWSDASDLWWRETSCFVIGGGLSDALPYCGTLYDFKYYNDWQIEDGNGGTVEPTVCWDFRSMTAEDVRDTYPGKGTLAGLQAMTGDFLSDEFIPIINKEYEGFDKDSILELYCSVEALCDELSRCTYTYSDGLWRTTTGNGPYRYLIMDENGKYFNGMGRENDLSEARDLTEGVEAGDMFSGDMGYSYIFTGFNDSVIDVYYADGRKNVVTSLATKFELCLYPPYIRTDNGVAESDVFGIVSVNNRYIQGFGWVNNRNANLRMMKNGNKCLFVNPLFKGYTALNAWGIIPDSVEDAESSPASWHLLSTVASSELAITDNSGKPVCPDRVSVTSISGAVYQCAVRDGGTVDVSSLPQGFYLLTATCGDVTQTLKFIKK